MRTRIGAAHGARYCLFALTALLITLLCLCSCSSQSSSGEGAPSFDHSQEYMGQNVKVLDEISGQGWRANGSRTYCNVSFLKSERKAQIFYHHDVYRDGSDTSESYECSATFDYTETSSTEDQVELSLSNPKFFEDSTAPQPLQGQDVMTITFENGKILKIEGALPTIGIERFDSSQVASLAEIETGRNDSYDSGKTTLGDGDETELGGSDLGSHDSDSGASAGSAGSGSGGYDFAGDYSNRQSAADDEDLEKCPVCGRMTDKSTLDWQGMCDKCLRNYKQIEAMENGE